MNETTKTGRYPSHEVFQVTERGSKKSYWTKIGAAWQHNDGTGMNIQLSSIPLDGKLVIRAIKKKDESNGD